MEFLPEIVVSVLSIFLIPGIIHVIKLWRSKTNPSEKLQRGVVTAIAFVLSVIGAFIWSGTAVLPDFGGDPLEFIGSLLSVASVFFAAVKGVYDYILHALFERLGWVVESE